MKRPVVIIGGGWAGLAAAVELTGRGIPIRLFESAPVLGGRARTVQLGGKTRDNGQHILLGAYRETLRLMERIGVAADRVLHRLPLQLEMRGEYPLTLRTGPLPAPLHLAWGLVTASGLSLSERLAALRLLRTDGNGPDEPLTTLFRRSRQPEALIRTLWEPLCLAALNTYPYDASARVFLQVLGDAFGRHRADSDLLLPAAPLGRLFPEPAAEWLQAHGAEVITALGVKGITCGDVHTLTLANGESVTADDMILACPPRRTRALLGEACPAFDHEPIATVYLHYPMPVPLDPPMVGVTGRLSQWIFDRERLCGEEGLVAVVISAGGAHTAFTGDELGRKVAAELAELHPAWPAPHDVRVIREKRATFRCSPGLNRPANRTQTPGVWLAGDYTDTGYPATLEGAVRSGVECARQIAAARSE